MKLLKVAFTILALAPGFVIGEPTGSGIKEFYDIPEAVGWFNIENEIKARLPENITKDKLVQRLLDLSEEKVTLIHLQQSDNYLIQYFFEEKEENGIKTKYDCRVMFVFTENEELGAIEILYDTLSGISIEQAAGGDAVR